MDRESNLTGWQALLGERQGTDCVTPYAAPARAVDMSNLPPAYIDAGDAEVFRDEAVAYATALWAAGVNADLHVWSGGFHTFLNVPGAKVSRGALDAIDNWLGRILSR